MQSHKKRNVLLAVGTLIIALIMAYWFFYHTVRGSSFAVYIVGGWGAPVSVKWECATITDFDVAEKFTLPLLFDQKTKNELKGFWFYSYYRQCLFDHGYDFKGDPVPPSSIVGNTYTNPYGDFSFLLPAGTTLISDNKLDVDYNDQLLVSSLNVGGNALYVHVLLKSDDFKTFDDLKNNLEHISFNEPDIENSDVLKSTSGIDVLRVRDASSTEGVVFITPELHIVYIFGTEQLKTTLDEIALQIATF